MTHWFLLFLFHRILVATAAVHDYGGALSKGFLFYEAQRSGYLPSDQRVKWRDDSGLDDGKSDGVDLVGGYYDAGDNVKFGLPMAFTITMMSWSIIEYGRQMSATGELGNAMDAVKWGTDYFIKAHPQPNILYGEVGDGDTDHYCWQRPEDMTTSRKAYKIDESNPGSDLAGETAAAMAAASIVFRHSNPDYSSLLLIHARQLFEFADKFRGVYDRSITVVQSYYSSVSGYDDELLWAAAWLYQASDDSFYLSYLADNGDSLGGTKWSNGQFSWDVKYAGVQVIVSKFLMQGKAGPYASIFSKYQRKAETFMCAQIGKGDQNIRKTPGGLLFVQRWNNMQFVGGASFLLTVFADYLSSVKSNPTVGCSLGESLATDLLAFAKSQVDYILGDNPSATSYLVGYGNSFPRFVHHRGSSIVSIKVDRKFVTCRGGYSTWFSSDDADPNPLHGAVVRGPGQYDEFLDSRENFRQTEPTLYNTAPLLGLLARLSGGGGGYNHNPLIPVLPEPPSKPSPSTATKVSSSSPIMVKQEPTGSWAAKGRTYYRYSTRVTNNSRKPLKSVEFEITKLYGPVWGLSRNGSFYGFPEWVDSVNAGRSFEFIYIHAAPPAAINVSKYTLG